MSMKFKTGNWVIVTRRRLDGPDMELKGKVIAASPDFATAECWFQGQRLTFTLCDETQGLVSFRRMNFSRR